MGFLINISKSQIEPQELTWLGILWHPLTGHWQTAPGTREKIVTTTKSLLEAGHIMRRQQEALVGLINFACQDHCHLRIQLQPLTRGSLVASTQDRDVPKHIQPRLQLALEVWTDLTLWTHIPQFQANFPQLFLWTDASLEGWGALLHPHAITRGMWSPTDKEIHINTLELRAVRLTIQFFLLSRCHIVVYTDNETVRYTLKQLRTKSTPLREELKSLLNYTVGRRMIMQPLCIPTELNKSQTD